MTTAPHASAGPRQRLLGAAIAYFAKHGTSEISLRTLATAIGTSHRMLIYHFGSKERLLVEVVRSIEDEQRRVFASLDDELDPPAAARAFWRRLSDPSLAPFERLFFEVYGQALQRRSWALPLLDGVIDDWVAPAAQRLIARGVPRAQAEAEARLGVDVTRGLLLDLLATGDRRGVNAAAERFFARYDEMATGGAPRATPSGIGKDVSPGRSRRPRRRSVR